MNSFKTLNSRTSSPEQRHEGNDNDSSGHALSQGFKTPESKSDNDTDFEVEEDQDEDDDDQYLEDDDEEHDVRNSTLRTRPGSAPRQRRAAAKRSPMKIMQTFADEVEAIGSNGYAQADFEGLWVSRSFFFILPHAPVPSY